jgi:hypothetical protein
MHSRNRVSIIALLLSFSLLGMALVTPSDGQVNARKPLQASPTASFGAVIGGGTTIATASPTSNVTPTPLPTLRADLMGIQVYANLQQDLWFGTVDRAQFMGFKWIKIQLSWKELEPNAKGQFSPQMAVLKENTIYAGRRGFKILLSIAKAPDWARPANARGQRDGPPANPQDLSDIITEVLNQFGTDYINAFEIWNEPNTAAEWTGASPDGATYMKYFNAGLKAVRAKSATMPVITAGPAPQGSADRQWLQQLYDAGLPKSDPTIAIGVHPYGWANPPDARCCTQQPGVTGWFEDRSFYFLDTITDYRAIMVKNGHEQGKLWATEFGWATFKGLHFKDHVKGPAAIPPAENELAWMNVLTEDQQADYIVRAFQLAQTGELASFMGPMFLWNMNFSTLPGYVNEDKPSLPEAGFSVLDNDWNTRPAYLRLQAAPKQ